MIPRFIHSGMAGAPGTGTVAGAHLSIMDAVLRTGFNIKTPNSVTVAAGVATFNYLAAHGYEDKCWLRIAGAGAAALNADLQCAVPSSTSFTVPAVGVPDGPVSGTIETRVAPLGWERPFEGSNKAVYRSANVAGTRRFFQIDDTNISGGSYCHIRGYEDMSSVDAGVNPFPTLDQVAATTPAISMYKQAAGAAWCAIGDDLTVHFACGVAGQHGIAAFGDFASYKPADAHAAFVSSAYHGYYAGIGDCTGGSQNMFTCRDSSGLIKSQFAARQGPSPGASGGNAPYPNTVTGGVTLSRPLLHLDGVGTTRPVRGACRGPIYVYEQMPVYPWAVIPSMAGINGRVVVVSDANGSRRVAFAVDEVW